jgi:hypothetical protein
LDSGLNAAAVGLKVAMMFRVRVKGRKISQTDRNTHAHTASHTSDHTGDGKENIASESTGAHGSEDACLGLRLRMEARERMGTRVRTMVKVHVTTKREDGNKFEDEELKTILWWLYSKVRVKRDGERAQIRSTLWLREKAMVGEILGTGTE